MRRKHEWKPFLNRFGKLLNFFLPFDQWSIMKRNVIRLSYNWRWRKNMFCRESMLYSMEYVTFKARIHVVIWAILLQYSTDYRKSVKFCHIYRSSAKKKTLLCSEILTNIIIVLDSFQQHMVHERWSNFVFTSFYALHITMHHRRKKWK